MILRVIGDIHGKLAAYRELIEDVDYSIQVGDFGFRQEYESQDKYLWRTRRLKTKDHFFVPGNHDDYDNLPGWSMGDFGSINDYVPELKWKGYYVRGAHSIDIPHRTEGVDWWRNEELDYMEAMAAIDAYLEMRPEIVISHELPSNVARQLFTTQTTFKSRTGSMLDAMFDEHRPRVWIFGHWHKSAHEIVDGTHFICLNELEYVDIDLGQDKLEILFKINKVKQND